MELAVHIQRNFAEVKHPNRDYALQSCPLFRGLRHRNAQLTPICLSEEIRKPFVLLRIPLIPSGGKRVLLMKKKRLHVVFFSIYARSLKDQARKSKYPRTQILEPRTQPKLICHSSTTFIPTRSNNLIEVTSPSYIAQHRKLYRNQSKAIQLSSPSYIALPTHPYTYIWTIAQAHLFITRTSFPRKSESSG